MLGWLGLAVVVVLFDQLTKTWVVATLPFRHRIELLPFFNLTHVHNTGAAFSFLSDAGGWQRWFFLGLALVASVVIVAWLRRLPKTARLEAFSLTLVLGGALGNFIDRLRFGYVIDFLDFHLGGWHWPAFNLADAAITIGVVLLLWEGVRGRESNTVTEERHGS
ncbi:MAG TPA: lipoprotein signal peptidase [Methylothermaceae bacterium]|nr:lipoprotein signal peptidase [Methylothermaceae bacterium]